MGKHTFNVFRGRIHGFCIGCHIRFAGPGDRCPKCTEKLRERKRRKPR